MIDISKERAGAFLNAMAQAKKGDSILYWVGEYCGGPHRNEVMAAHETGYVAPVQKRLGPKQFAYIAQVAK